MDETRTLKSHPTPCISIYVDSTDAGASTEEANKMMKCKSMQNMKLTSSLKETERYKQNLSQFNNNANCLFTNALTPIKSDTIRLRNYRKCLSRVNLNLYQNPVVNSSTRPADKDNYSAQSQSITNNFSPKLVKINPIRGAKVYPGGFKSIIWSDFIFLYHIIGEKFPN